MITVNIDKEQEQKSISDVPTLCTKAEIVISNQNDFEVASTILSDVKARYKELDAQRKKITKPIDDAKKEVMDLFRKPLELLEAAESKLKRLMLNYTSEQERIAREKQRELERLAEIEAEKERKKLEAKIERAKASGKDEKVEMLEEQKENIAPIVVPVIQAQIEPPKGVFYRENWTARVVNESLVPREYLIVNIQALNSIAKSTKGTLTIPGVKFVSEKILVSK